MEGGKDFAAATIIGPTTARKIDRAVRLRPLPRYVLLNYLVVTAALAVNTQKQSGENLGEHEGREENYKKESWHGSGRFYQELSWDNFVSSRHFFSARINIGCNVGLRLCESRNLDPTVWWSPVLFFH